MDEVSLVQFSGGLNNNRLPLAPDVHMQRASMCRHFCCFGCVFTFFQGGKQYRPKNIISYKNINVMQEQGCKLKAFSKLNNLEAKK